MKYLHRNDYFFYFSIFPIFFKLLHQDNSRNIKQSHIQSRKFLFSINRAISNSFIEIRRETNIFESKSSRQFYYYAKYERITISRNTREKNQSFLSFVSVLTQSTRWVILFPRNCYSVVAGGGGRGRLYWRNESFKVNDFTISNNDFYGFQVFPTVIRLCADSGPSRFSCNAQLYSMCIAVQGNNDRTMLRLR